MAAQQAADRRPFIERIGETPAARDDARTRGAIAALKERARSDAALAPLAATLENPRAIELLAGIFTGSPYLSGLIERDPARLALILTTAPETRLAQLNSELGAKLKAAETRPAAMRALRQFKSEVAVLTALADLGGVWPVLSVTGALTECADATLRGAVDFLFREATARGQW
ncbi:MAG: bifunctional [glutamine synthetase] adenylyltransferase/[glutamine synthetase]-adenylyl-L-tyrosine phosphorylase, partial [Hyphomicrobium sp.]|nr:bifunctional [glutamine synthetase] adenylyltransferase/[glutamine synthetase]-adenylyl-L-tyrosine phosphorylase [Hyphomicrobium sp.]